jgi:hypothetical protein
MAEAQGLSRATIRCIWKRHNFKRHLVKVFKISCHQYFVEKLQDVIGLYLNPRTTPWARVSTKKANSSPFDRTQPGLPIKKGRCGIMRHDCKRHGATTLFAALSLLDGMVIGNCMPRHRHQEFIRFLKKINADTLAATPPAVPSAFHPDVEFVGEHGRAMVRDLTDQCIHRGSSRMC